MPSVLPDAVVTNAATPVIINVLANDTGANLTITSFSNPANGSLVFNGDKTFTYTPMAGFIGDDSFAYTVRDAQGTPVNAEVTVSVVPNTGATIATDDVVEVIAGASVVIPVLANDMVAGGGTLQIIAVSMPGHGAINVLPDQTIRYVPQGGFTGIDSFNYTVIDGQGSSASATVTVKVLTENRPPVAAADTFTVEAGQPTVLAVLANDSDPESGPLQIVGFTMPSQGSLVFNPDKTFTYTPAAGYLGNDQFTYTIRDNRGASAQASVSLSILEVLEGPDAAADSVTTEAGVPVVIDVLANDTLPAGQEIGIVAVTLPYRGKLTFNPDKTITYTPNPGFVGIDDFTYTISNGKGGTATARVTVEVTAVANVATYANGYGYRRRIVVPAQADSQASIEDGVILLHEQGAWLKHTTHGGKVTSPDGADIRLEDAAGSKLDHEIESYDPESGELLAWVRLPNWSLADQAQLLLFYGKDSVAQSEDNPTGVWQGYLARWRLSDGSDATANGRDLTPESVTWDKLLGGAARLDGAGRLSQSDPSWLDGLSAMTLQALVKPDAAAIGGTMRIVSQDGDTSVIALGYMAEANSGAPNVVYASFGCTDGEAEVFSRADQQSTQRQLIHASWRANTAPSLFLNGTQAVPSSSQARSGTTHVAAGSLEVGRHWVGLIDEIRVSDRQLPAAWLAVEARNMLSPKLSYGLGQQEDPNTAETAVVAVPFNVKVDAGKWIDVKVLDQIFAPASGGTPTIVNVTSPTNGSASVVGDAVRYASTGGFVGKDQLTYTISNGGSQSVGLIDVTVVDPTSQGQGELPAGKNLLLNSKLLGAVGNAPDNWTFSFPNEGTVDLASSWDNHRQLRCISTGPDRAAIEQDIVVEQGKRYSFSIDCVAINNASDAERVVLNIVPAAAVTFVSERPKMGDLLPGGRYHFMFEAIQTQQVKLRVGLATQQGSGGADVIFTRPMLDESTTVRGYVATGPLATPEAGSLNWDLVQNNGQYDGWIGLCGHANMSQRIRGGYYGWRMTMRRAGTLIGVQHQIASNRTGETSKSRVNGNNAHDFPASWKLGFRIFNADANWQITGSALRDIQWTYTNPDGGSGASSSNNSRVLFEHEVSNLEVAEGQRLLFLVYNRENSPENNHPSVNMTLNQGRPALGQNPPRAVSRFWGDDPIHVRSTSFEGTLSPGGNGELFGLGLRYADGVVDGHVGFDSSGSVFTAEIGGQQRARQRWSSPYWRKTAKIAIATYRLPGIVPQAGLTLRISGPDISTMQLVLPADQVQIFDPTASPFTYEYTHQIFNLPGNLILSPKTIYTIELMSSNSSNTYHLNANRHYSNGEARPVNSTGSFLTKGLIEPHRWSGTAEKSGNGGESWSDVGWAGGGSDLPIAFVIDRQMAATIEGLSG